MQNDMITTNTNNLTKKQKLTPKTLGIAVIGCGYWGKHLSTHLKCSFVQPLFLNLHNQYMAIYVPFAANKTAPCCPQINCRQYET